MIAICIAVGLSAGATAAQAGALPMTNSSRAGASILVADMGSGRSWGYGGRRYRSEDRIYRGFYGRPFIGYGAYYGGGYSEGCHWIRRRAQATGGRYWWARYQDCIDKNF
jgi:hypothetical protein